MWIFQVCKQKDEEIPRECHACLGYDFVMHALLFFCWPRACVEGGVYRSSFFGVQCTVCHLLREVLIFRCFKEPVGMVSPRDACLPPPPPYVLAPYATAAHPPSEPGTYFDPVPCFRAVTLVDTRKWRPDSSRSSSSGGRGRPFLPCPSSSRSSWSSPSRPC